MTRSDRTKAASEARSATCLRAVDGGVIVHVVVRPKARKSAILGVRDGELELRIAALPADGEANRELVRFLAKALGVPKSNVSLLRGSASRHKQLRIAEIGVDELTERLDGLFGV